MRVRPGRLIIAAACCAALASLPASVAQATSTGGTLSMGAPPAHRTPGAARVTLTAAPARPMVNRPLRLAVTRAPAGASDFGWDLDGRGLYARHTGVRAQTGTVFTSPGIHVVSVRFTVDGRTRLAALTVTVRSPRRARARRQPGAAPRPGAREQPAASGSAGHLTAHAAGDPGVTVADFHFSPATTTIHVGDTITWTNDGPSSHTATARDGSFDTGVLKKEHSASHTFTQPGTFTYFCQIHPFMHGTIVVLAGTTTATTSGTTTTPPAATPATTTPATPAPTATTAVAPTAPTLPSTGFNVLAALVAGLLLLALGAGLRRAQRR